MSEAGNEEKKVVTIECKYCEAEVLEGSNYCSKCGGVMDEVSAEELLEIEITVDDIENYIFSGSMTKVIKLRPNVFIKLTTLTEKDLETSSMSADKEIGEVKFDLSIDSVSLIKNRHQLALGFKGVADKADADEFKIPAEMGRELHSIVMHKAFTLQKALNEALQTNLVIDF